ncbi:hypothetical protein [Methylorubrum sp. GM97]|nr:hypothetical protein [Methylorubrum sp. GM97]
MDRLGGGGTGGPERLGLVGRELAAKGDGGGRDRRRRGRGAVATTQ